jgi:DNA (cytosine-5)-methyltransferase 1
VKVGSLFSGYGGLDLAVNEVFDASVAWHCEWEDAPSRILEAHFPGVPNFRDVSKVDFTAVEPVDILTGGFPCQDLSLAGKRAGLGEGRPEWVVIENVRGLLSASANGDVEHCAWCMGETGDGEPPLRALGAVLGNLAERGYDAEWHGVEASEAGAPHRRFRVFILAHTTSAGFSGGNEAGGSS